MGARRSSKETPGAGWPNLDWADLEGIQRIQSMLGTGGWTGTDLVALQTANDLLCRYHPHSLIVTLFCVEELRMYTRLQDVLATAEGPTVDPVWKAAQRLYAKQGGQGADPTKMAQFAASSYRARILRDAAKLRASGLIGLDAPVVSVRDSSAHENGRRDAGLQTSLADESRERPTDRSQAKNQTGGL